MKKILSLDQAGHKERSTSVYRFNPLLRPAYVDPTYPAAKAILDNPQKLLVVDCKQALYEAYEMRDKCLISNTTFSTLTLYLHAIYPEDCNGHDVSFENKRGEWITTTMLKRSGFSLVNLIKQDENNWSEFASMVLDQMNREYSLPKNDLHLLGCLSSVKEEGPMAHYALRFSYSIQEWRDANWFEGHELAGVAALLGVGAVLRKIEMQTKTNREIKNAFLKKTSIAQEEFRPPCWAIFDAGDGNDDTIDIVLLPETIEKHLLQRLFPDRRLIELSHEVAEATAKELVEALTPTSRLSYLGDPESMDLPSSFDEFVVTSQLLTVIHDRYHRMRYMLTPKEVFVWAKAIYLECVNNKSRQEALIALLFFATKDKTQKSPEEWATISVEGWDEALFECVDVDMPHLYVNATDVNKRVVLAIQFASALLRWVEKRLEIDLEIDSLDDSRLVIYIYEMLVEIEQKAKRQREEKNRCCTIL